MAPAESPGKSPAQIGVDIYKDRIRSVPAEHYRLVPNAAGRHG
ncbi:MAG: hypothetical protein WBO57_04305 [Gammaproteobacteria bacterium]